MSTTLTNGLKLPDKGSVDWYADMQNNYAILDGAVGTVAEHTTALSGKAPLVHTHTKADITDFPALATVATSGSYNDLSNIPATFTPSSHTHGNITNDGKVGTAANVPLITGTGGAVQAGSFGNAANTFCEGNDSRLSDARTPVAHTHTKSDVTDLLNSNFIPSANTSYDLGSASKQWNNLYAKNYYYNGTAWGLDKANEWSNANTYTNILLTLKHTALEVGVLPASNQTRRYRFADKNNANLGWVQHRVNTSGDSYIEIYSVNRFGDGQYSPQGSDVANALSIGLHSDGKRYAQIASDFFPINTNLNCNLGTSTNKWKSLNGINPGALSLPNLTSNGYINLSDNISANTEYSYTPPADGWLALYVLTTGFHVENAVGIFNGSSSGNAHRLACSATSGINLARSNYYHGAVLLPVITGIPYLCWIKIDSSTTLASKVLYFYTAAGNV